MLLVMVSLVIIQSEDLKNELYHKLLLVLSFPLGIGCGCFQTNIVHFGVDQRYDAISSEIMFIIWGTHGSFYPNCVFYVYTALALKLPSRGSTMPWMIHHNIGIGYAWHDYITLETPYSYSIEGIFEWWKFLHNLKAHCMCKSKKKNFRK